MGSGQGDLSTRTRDLPAGGVLETWSDLEQYILSVLAARNGSTDIRFCVPKHR